jgi:hypothetical protein
MSQFLLARGGQAEDDVALEKVKNNPDYSTEDRKREFARVMFNPEYRDAKLTEVGK